jgi:glycosyltransferase involved in cell wall biosynthesis
MLALAFVGWLADAHPEVAVDVVAFRGGDLAEELGRHGSVTVLLHHHEPWDHRAPDPARVAEIAALTRALAPADATLLVSVAAGQCLAHLPGPGPVITWSVEQGEDLHWVADGIGLVERTTTWLAGTDDVRAEVLALLGPGASVAVVPEFVAPPAQGGAAAADVRRCRAEAGATDGELLVVGAGIATHRKAPDLFVEVALAHLRAGGAPARFAWVGGSGDELFGPVRAEVERLGLGDRILVRPEVPDLGPWLAAADVFVHPARLDAFPLVCLHAAAVATPVVAFSGVGGVPAMLGEAFLGAPYPDVAGLARAVQSLAEPAARAAAGEAQRARVASRYLAPAAAPALWRHVEAVA